MRYASRRRLATCLLSAAYLLANLAGGLLHDHAHSHGDHTIACRHAHHDHGDHDHASHGQAGGGAMDFAVSASHDDCTVCRAAGQRTLAVEFVRLERLHNLVAELPTTRAGEPCAAFARTCRSRAPPLFG